AAMPRVGARLGDHVDHGTGIAAIFRTKVIGNDHVLANVLRVGKKESRSTYAVVVVVLTVNFLVIVTATQAVAGEPNAIRIGKVVAAGGYYARHKQSQTGQTFVLLDAGKAAQGGACESAAYLGLCGLDQRGFGRHFNRG